MMLLENKVAVIYGAGGAIGGAVARVFAREGATVHLAGRTEASLKKVTDDIASTGGRAHAHVADALDEAAVEGLVDTILQQSRRLDVSFNLIGVGDVQRPLLDLSLDEFLQPIQTSMRTQFLTTKAAARPMIQQRSGVILTFGGSGPQTVAGIGGFKISLDALEGLRRQWALELGEHGIRVLTLKTGGIPESMPLDVPERDAILASLEEPTLLKRTATLDDVGNVAAFAASDFARTITSTEINISCGAIVD